MRRLRFLFPLLLVPAALPANAPTGALILDDVFASGNSQTQDLANNSVWLFNGRTTTVRTDQVGSVNFDMTSGGTSSDAFWAFFTDAGSPIALGVGDKLSVSATFSTTGFAANGQDIRWGVLDSKGTRNASNLTGGMSDATFVGDTGYGLQFYGSGNGNPFVLGRRAVLSSANVFNSFGDFAAISGTGPTARQTLSDGTLYTLTYAVGDPDANSMASQPLDNTNTGRLSFTMPSSAGQYEFRLFDGNGVRVAASGTVTVQ